MDVLAIETSALNDTSKEILELLGYLMQLKMETSCTHSNTSNSRYFNECKQL